MAWARKAVRGGDAAALPRVRTSPAARRDPREPIVEVRYHGTPIAAGALGEDGLCRLLPFAGGALDRRKFAVSTYVAPGARAPAVATLVIVREPSLSDLERRALERLPRESRLALGRERDAGTTVSRLLAMRAKLMLAGRLS